MGLTLLKSEILIYNYTSHSVPPKKFFEKIINFSLKQLKEKEKISLALVFVDSFAIKKLNSYWRKKDYPPTVLSFPLKEKKKEELDGVKILGDIFLCPSEIEKQAKERNLNLRDFYLMLLVHSLLHLYGFTHETERKQRQMEKLEKLIISLIKF
ncbi:MAG: rRNA maturation RNase YbeY [Candidatus Paceibacterota bacterium]|jgi:probable rRNA maturation factor|nr:rRNA maturation RNase YbeY [Candidatus Paceibacterota bacterium]MDD3548755.1 rRNA maturation RNase YbeY [Candidatus Paceibacterota bacterium]MDD4998957.1 rRNA maturation RNase YbeY [Candidatus Paceibacterota bacterium]MDD5545409.1 rRNA maturation RNase YbeY [Candidatus Paceibacterota bacterium]